MADTLQADYVTGKTVYFLLRDGAGNVWDGAAFAAFNAANLSAYKIAAAEQGSSGYYTAAVPAVARGAYNAVAKEQTGGGPAVTDNSIGGGNFDWSGTAFQVNPANFAALSINAAGRVEVQSPVTKNVALNAFPFLMVLAADNVTPAPGLTVTATRSIDGGAFAPCANAVTSVGSGIYVINLAAADLNGDTITLRFTAATADDRFIVLATSA